MHLAIIKVCLRKVRERGREGGRGRERGGKRERERERGGGEGRRERGNTGYVCVYFQYERGQGRIREGSHL